MSFPHAPAQTKFAEIKTHTDIKVDTVGKLIGTTVYGTDANQLNTEYALDFL